MKLTDMKCLPCEGFSQPLDKKQAQLYLKELPTGWKLVDESKIVKQFKFKNYPATMGFVNRVALIAQEEGHHPNMCVEYSAVKIELWTHNIGGLSENDFILAAKIEQR
jgi:4a-hydroxytetrahydrobiopterin dehydratase